MDLKALTVAVRHVCVHDLPPREEIARLTLCSRDMYYGTTQYRARHRAQARREAIVRTYEKKREDESDDEDSTASLIDWPTECVDDDERGYEYPLLEELEDEGLLTPDCSVDWLFNTFKFKRYSLLLAFEKAGVFKIHRTLDFCAKYFKGHNFHLAMEFAGQDASGLDREWFAARMKDGELYHGLKGAGLLEPGPGAPDIEWLGSHLREHHLSRSLADTEQMSSVPDYEWLGRRMPRNIRSSLSDSLILGGFLSGPDPPTPDWLVRHWIRDQSLIWALARSNQLSADLGVEWYRMYVGDHWLKGALRDAGLPSDD